MNGCRKPAHTNGFRPMLIRDFPPAPSLRSQIATLNITRNHPVVTLTGHESS